MRFPRLPSSLHHNTISARLEELRARGTTIVDLTESNPTAVGIDYPDDLLAVLSAPDALRYTPSPFGITSARVAVANEFERRGHPIDPENIVLAASTSEAYAWLFKLLCAPGERVLVPRPSYPLFEHLARLEQITLDTYDLSYHGRWDIDVGAIERAADDVRAVVLVSPNNPTGSCVSPHEVEALSAICRQRGWVLIADEVFADYLLEARDYACDLAANAGCLTVSLGGLSKSVGLPQVKVAWMVLGGPAPQVTEAKRGLEIVADAFLSVSTPAQIALADLLRRGDVVRRHIHSRARENLSILREVAATLPLCDVPHVDGGWSAPIRVPATRSEESVVLAALEQEHVLVHPGFFFDFRHEAYLVVSLIVDPAVLREALPRVLRVATA